MHSFRTLWITLFLVIPSVGFSNFATVERNVEATVGVIVKPHFSNESSMPSVIILQSGHCKLKFFKLLLLIEKLKNHAQDSKRHRFKNEKA